jgi:hypothetical protein
MLPARRAGFAATGRRSLARRNKSGKPAKHLGGAADSRRDWNGEASATRGVNGDR